MIERVRDTSVVLSYHQFISDIIPIISDGKGEVATDTRPSECVKDHYKLTRFFNVPQGRFIEKIVMYFCDSLVTSFNESGIYTFCKMGFRLDGDKDFSYISSNRTLAINYIRVFNFGKEETRICGVERMRLARLQNFGFCFLQGAEK